jgi:hypothetical protein
LLSGIFYGSLTVEVSVILRSINMQILIYSDSGALPGSAIVPVFSNAVQSLEDTENSADGTLKNFLLALHKIDLPLFAHVHVRNLGGISRSLSTSITMKEMRTPLLSQYCYVVWKNFFYRIEELNKSEEQWEKYFFDVFETEKAVLSGKIDRAKIVIDALNGSPTYSLREKYIGPYSDFRHCIGIRYVPTATQSLQE